MKTHSHENANTAENTSNMDLWHCRYGHLGADNLVKLSNCDMVDGLDRIAKNAKKSICEGCEKGKQHRLPYPKSSSSCTTDVLEIIHTDICGPMNMDSIGGSKYFITFIDFSRYVCVYYLKQKSEALSKFKEFVNLMTNITGKRVKVLRNDNGGGYCSHAFSEYLKEQGIKHETTVPYNPAQNGLAERMNHTIVESARSMIHFSNVPKEFWAEAVNTAVYLKNRSPSVALKEEMPYECMFGVKPNVSSLKIFGCIAHVHIDSQARKKFDMKSRKAIFVGYPEGTKGFKLYDPVVKRFLCSRDVIFDEGKFYNFKEKNLSHSNVEIIDHDILHDEQNAENEVASQDNMRDNAPVGENYEQRFLRELENLPQKRQRKAPQRLIEEEADCCYISDILTADIEEPKSLNEAWNGEYSIQWKEAMDSEFSSLQSNETWDLVPAPKNKKVVGCRWIFKVKRKSNGSLDRFKARLVVQGYTQEQGVDYHEGFAQSKPTVLFEDNQSAMELSKNPKFHSRTKHIDISYHFVRQKVADKQIEVMYCPTEMMVADMLTKGLAKVKFEQFRDMIGLTRN